MGEIGELASQIRNTFKNAGHEIAIAAHSDLNRFRKKSEETKQLQRADAIMTEAYSVAWGKVITGRNVVFPRGDGTITWGVEFSIPLEFNQARFVYENLVNQIESDQGFQIPTEIKQQELAFRKDRRYYDGPSNIRLPEKIKSIKILDLAPQEILDKKQRNIPSHRTKHHEKHPIRNIVRGDKDRIILDRVISTLFKEDLGAHTRKKALDELFKDMFGSQSKEQIAQLLLTLNQSNAQEIVFIHAHGGDDEIIGEETSKLIRDEGMQNPGNRIGIEEVIEEYSNPNETAAILLASCYVGDENNRLVKRPVRVFSMQGISGTNRGFIGQFFPSKTSVSLPSDN